MLKQRMFTTELPLFSAFVKKYTCGLFDFITKLCYTVENNKKGVA